MEEWEVHPRPSSGVRRLGDLSNRDKLRANWNGPARPAESAPAPPGGPGALAGDGALRALRAQDARQLLWRRPPASLSCEGLALYGWRAPVSRSGVGASTRRWWTSLQTLGAGGGRRHRGGARGGRGPSRHEAGGLRAAGRAGELRGRARPASVRRRRAGEPARRAKPRSRVGKEAVGTPPGRGGPRHPAGSAPTGALRRGGGVAGRAGADLRAVFAAETTTQRERKLLLRLLITEVVVTVEREAGQAAVRIIWEGGACTNLDITWPRRGAAGRATPSRRRSRSSGVSPPTTTTRRSRAPFPPGPPERHRPSLHRRAGGLHPQKSRHPRPSGADAPGPRPRRRRRDGDDRRGAGAPWRLEVDAAPLAARGDRRRRAAEPGRPVAGAGRPRPPGAHRERGPPGFLGLAEAANALGVARQTVLDRVRRGELNAVHVNRGRRKGLAIEIPAPPQRLF